MSLFRVCIMNSSWIIHHQKEFVVGHPEVSRDMRIWNTDIVHGAGRKNDREYSAGYIFSWTHGQTLINSPALFVKYTFNVTLIKQLKKKYKE